MSTGKDNPCRLNDIINDLHVRRFHDEKDLSDRSSILSELTVSLILKRRKIRHHEVSATSLQINDDVVTGGHETGKSREQKKSPIKLSNDDAKISDGNAGIDEKKVTHDAIQSIDIQGPLKFEKTAASVPALSSRLQSIMDAYLPRSILISGEEVTGLKRKKISAAKNGSDEQFCDVHSSNLSDVALKIQELRRVYTYGLQQVSELQDLQKAPDAILPGNFVDSYS